MNVNRVMITALIWEIGHALFRFLFWAAWYTLVFLLASSVVYFLSEVGRRMWG